MRITYDPGKRVKALKARGIDFADAMEIFASTTLNMSDHRKNYGEMRVITVGHLRDRMMVVVWTPRSGARHVISMRKANDREKARFGQRLAQD